jgi:hypothetical protein
VGRADDPVRSDASAPVVGFRAERNDGPDTSLLGGAAAASTLLILNYPVADVSGGSQRFRRLIEGEPLR